MEGEKIGGGNLLAAGEERSSFELFPWIIFRVTRLSLEWRAIWFEYFWRVLCQFLTMGLCAESEFGC